LLSQALIAFTIEFDNDFEQQMPHRTTNHGSTPGSHDAPWVIWMKFMRFVHDDGITVQELQRQLQITDKDMHARLTRLGKWWGYLVIEPAVVSGGSKRIDPGAVVRPTNAGHKARAVWQPLVLLGHKG
jgi:hypothetical protein